MVPHGIKHIKVKDYLTFYPFFSDILTRKSPPSKIDPVFTVQNFLT